MTNPRQARALDVLLAEVNAHAPHRSKVSDGGIGDDRHAAEVSDHNPNAAGVWRARDVTNDPAGGMPGRDLADRVAAKLGKLPALGSGAYVIFSGQIISTNRLREGWRPYTRSNPHEHHVHVSVATSAAGYDSTVPWHLWSKPKPTPTIDHAISDLIRARDARPKGGPVRKRLEAALAGLRAIRKAAR